MSGWVGGWVGRLTVEAGEVLLLLGVGGRPVG